MTRRFFGISTIAFLAACSGAGISTEELENKVAQEVARIVINRQQLSPWTTPGPVDEAQVNAAIDSVRMMLADRHMKAFSLDALNDLRRFYSRPDGQAVIAHAFAQEGNIERPGPANGQPAHLEAVVNDPVTARSLKFLRDVLATAFDGPFSF